MGLPMQWAPVGIKPDSKEVGHVLPDGTMVPLGDPRGLVPYGTGFSPGEPRSRHEGAGYVPVGGWPE